MTSINIAIQVKTAGQYFYVELFVMLYKMVLMF